MMSTTVLCVLSVLVPCLTDSLNTKKETYGNNTDYDAAKKFLWENDAQRLIMNNKEAIAEWNYASNLTEENKKAMLQSNIKSAKFSLETWKNATIFNWKDSYFRENNETVYRWFKDLTTLRIAALPEDKLKKFNELIAEMQNVYDKAKVCSKDSPADKPCDLSLDPELTRILKKSRDYEELKKIWKDWRDVSGKKVKKQFLEYVELFNEAANLNGFSDGGKMWMDEYEGGYFESDAQAIWVVFEPFYKQLHSFVRRRLIQQYPDCRIRIDGPIPAHLLGNMWAKTWKHIFSIVKPFTSRGHMDVTARMVKRKMTHKKMFKMSEEFYTSLGLYPMTAEFWNRSIIEKPKDREMNCHTPSYDFFDGKDFRIKMCTKVDMESFIEVHHNMGHIQYYQQYAHQPAVFRDEPCPGFHEAVGGALALSASTADYFIKIGLMNPGDKDNETAINNLMLTALKKFVFLPFAYLVDEWRFNVFSGNYSKEELNKKWWEQRLKYQGVCPPVKRTNDDLDAASKYHVISNMPYLKYVFSTIVQFQVHTALCEAAGHKGPLHECNIYQSKEAGKLLSEAVSLGKSVHWTEVLKVITNGRKDRLDVTPLLEYFDPLMKWLKKQNEGENAFIGWKSPDPMICP